jgi:hypothetical protein
MNNAVGFCLLIDAGSIPAEPTNVNRGGIVPVKNSKSWQMFFGAGSIPAVPNSPNGAFLNLF